MSEKEAPTIGATARRTRAALFFASESLTEQVELIAGKITKLLKSKSTNSQALAQMLTAQGIAVDKLTTILKNLRNLESETESNLEASFVIIEEDEKGYRRIVSCAPELPALKMNCYE